jgi:hypothetical protein
MKVLLASLVLIIMPAIAHAQMTPPWWPFSSPRPIDNQTEIDRTTTGSITVGAPARMDDFEYSASNGFGDRSPKALLRPRT